MVLGVGLDPAACCIEHIPEREWFVVVSALSFFLALRGPLSFVGGLGGGD